jgi:hypothetical protein
MLPCPWRACSPCEDTCSHAFPGFPYHGAKNLSQQTVGYCWRIYFKVLEVLFLRQFPKRFCLPRKAC